MNRFISTIVGLFAVTVGLSVAGLAIIANSREETFSSIVAGAVAAWLLIIGFQKILKKQDSNAWRSDSATERQKAFADDLGIDYHEGITKGELSDLITKATDE